MTPHQRDDGARVHAPAQQRPHRHVGDQTPRHRAIEQRGQLLDGRLERRGLLRFVLELPVAVNDFGAIAQAQIMRGRNLLQTLEGGTLRRDVSVREDMMNRRRIGLRLQNRIGKHRFGLGCEEERVRSGEVIQRLLAQPVAREKERPIGCVPDGKGKHPDQPIQAGRSQVFVQMEDRFGIGSGAEPVALFLEPGAQLQSWNSPLRRCAAGRLQRPSAGARDRTGR